MKTFYCKLISPRPSFVHDITSEETEIMQWHAVYWNECMDKGHVITFGFVSDPAREFGVCIVETESEAEARSLIDNDPAILSGRGFSYEIYPMPRGAVHPPFARG